MGMGKGMGMGMSGRQRENNRAASEPRQGARSFDEVDELSSSNLPFRASVQRQRVNSAGAYRNKEDRSKDDKNKKR